MRTPTTTRRPKALKRAIVGALDDLARLDPGELLASRYARIRSIGAYRETADRWADAALGEPKLRDRLGRLLHLPGVRPAALERGVAGR